MAKKEQIAILGAGNMGTAVAQVIATNGFKVKLWNYAGDPDPLQHIKECQENKKYLPGIQLSPNIVCEPDIEQAVSGASVVFIIVPSAFVQTVAIQVALHIPKGAICIDFSKGLDFSSKKYSLTTDVLQKILPENLIVAISGPAVASQMAAGEFTAMNVVSGDDKVIARIQKIMENTRLRLVPSVDYVGVEISASFKNVYAILMGICDGLGMAANTKAVVFTMALREMGFLVKKMGGYADTVYGLAGLGDLFTTAVSVNGRNRRLGELLGRGFDLNDAKDQVGQVVEGVSATQALRVLSKKYRVNLPLGNVLYNILYKHSNAKKELERYLSTIK
jgi:glycerol-3-phosphate dehydrogenase (NAD(P)+)